MKKLLLLVMTVACMLNMVGCKPGVGDTPYTSWKEEVRLSDDRVIVVNQKRRKGGLMARESWLSFKLPEFGGNEIVWHESLCPLVLNIYRGNLYVVGNPPTYVESEKYGNPHPWYVGFKWEGNAWHQIPFDEIPNEIYDTNLLIDAFAPNGTEYLTLDAKGTLNNRATMPKEFRRIDPNAPGFH